MLHCQDADKILLAAAARADFSRLSFHDPLAPQQKPQSTDLAYTAGFGVAVQPYHVGIFHLFFQCGYEERGSSEAYYFASSKTPYYLHIHDRFRCIYSDILARCQNKNGFYFAAGGSICKPLKGYYHNNSSSFTLPPGAIIIEPTELSTLTYGITIAAGKNFSGKTEMEINSTWDLTPVISRVDANIFIWVASFTVRYYFLRPDE